MCECAKKHHLNTLNRCLNVTGHFFFLLLSSLRFARQILTSLQKQSLSFGTPHFHSHRYLCRTQFFNRFTSLSNNRIYHRQVDKGESFFVFLPSIEHLSMKTTVIDSSVLDENKQKNK